MKRILGAIFFCLVRTNLGFCPEQCSCNDDVLVVECNAGRLEVLPITLNPGIQRLQLQHNKIRTVDAALGFYGQLQFVDLSHNELFSIPTGGFKAQKRLMELRLADNKISKITNSTFVGLKSLTILSLRENFLEELTAGLFALTPAIEELDVGKNRIRSIEAGAFAGMDQLRVLYVDGNELRSVPSASFHHVSHLAELHLGGNSIQRLPDEAFDAFGNLYQLDLEGASIYNVSERAFAGLESLRVLKLAGNALDNIPTRQMRRLDRLEQVELGENFIEVVHESAFEGLRKLRVLDLSNSPNLVRIAASAFKDSINLAWLSLSGCKSLRLDKGALKSVNSLKTVKLADMNLSRLERSLLPFHNIQSIDLQNNPLLCDCEAQWLKDVLYREGVEATGATCSAPARLAGADLADVSREQLTCGGGVGVGGGVGQQGQAVVAVVCVLAGLATGLLLLLLVHCHRKLCCCLRRPPACADAWCASPGRTGGPNDKEVMAIGHSDNLYNSYYPSSTKSTYCSDDDYFLTLSRDGKTFKPIPVSEL